MSHTTKTKSTLETAISAAKLVEKKYPQGDEKIVRQLLPLSIICDCFDWHESQILILEIRDHLMNQSSGSAAKSNKS